MISYPDLLFLCYSDVLWPHGWSGGDGDVVGRQDQSGKSNKI